MQNDKEFDINKFNAEFENSKEQIKLKGKQLEEQKLSQLNKAPPQKKIYELSVGEILIGIKDAWFGLLDDLLQQNFTFDILTKNNRLFFIGITVVIIVIVIYLYEVFTSDEEECKNPVKEIHHIYHLVPDEHNDKKEFWKNVSQNVVALNPTLMEESD